MNIDTTLQALLSEILKRPVGADENVLRADEPGWNSLAHMELVFMVEDEFGIEFEADEIADLVSRAQLAERVGALVEASGS